MGKLDEYNAVTTGRMPEISCFLVRKSKSVDVITVDSFDVKQVTEAYLELAEQYGETNVKYCKVIGITIEKKVSFTE